MSKPSKQQLIDANVHWRQRYYNASEDLRVTRILAKAMPNPSWAFQLRHAELHVLFAIDRLWETQEALK